VNRDEAKSILLLYRPGTADADDQQIAEALALANREPGLARWLEEHCARQEALRAKFRQIAVPAGLKEQIISEQAAFLKKNARREKIVGAAAVAAIALSLIFLAPFWLARRAAADNTLASYENQMVRLALSGYAMDLATNDPAQIRNYLAQKQAPADYALPAGLQKVAVTGCAVEGWQDTKAAMICFRTGKPLPPGQQNDLWLFVVDRAAVKNAPPPGPPRIAAVNRLITAVWTQGDKVYLLGTEGDAQAIRQYL
jgi:hypothetical protein